MPDFARRMDKVHRSFIREILKVTEDPEVISFAGGLPNPRFFPVREMEKAAVEVISLHGTTALQYSTTEGYRPLREFIVERYRLKKELSIDPANILITTGSQQGLDLLAKIFLNEGDRVLIERPGYLGSIQAFSLFQPQFATVRLEEDGPDLSELEEILEQGPVKFFYAVPNFQNPSGRTYSRMKRKLMAELLKKHDVLFVEDDPYGELRFKGEHKPSMHSHLGNQCIMLGSFSKVAAPGYRVGWITAPSDIMEKLITAKQAADLHTGTLSQRILYQFLSKNDLDEHIAAICEHYGHQRDVMVQAIKDHFPAEVRFTRPEGGMFLWVTLPEGCSSMDLLDLAVKDKVAFVPGRPFYVDGSGENTLRLNYSNADDQKIVEGIKRLGKSIESMLN